jgi:CPA1 family monovalent cation:H+ antiporter
MVRFHLERPVQIESTAATVLEVVGGSSVTGDPIIHDAYKSNGLDGGAADAVQALFAVALAAALAVPETIGGGQPFPDRDLILAVAALTILTSVLVQGLTLRTVVERAGLRDEAEEEREEQEARQAIKAGLASAAAEHADGFDATRQALVRLREHDSIGDEVLARMLRETDLTARAAEGDALPGAGPPNP